MLSYLKLYDPYSKSMNATWFSGSAPVLYMTFPLSKSLWANTTGEWVLSILSSRGSLKYKVYSIRTKIESNIFTSKRYMKNIQISCNACQIQRAHGHIFIIIAKFNFSRLIMQNRRCPKIRYNNLDLVKNILYKIIRCVKL